MAKSVWLEVLIPEQVVLKTHDVKVMADNISIDHPDPSQVSVNAPLIVPDLLLESLPATVHGQKETPENVAMIVGLFVGSGQSQHSEHFPSVPMKIF